MFFVYVIQSEMDNSFYVGSTANLEERLKFHNDPTLNIGKTRYKIPWKIYHFLKVPDKSVALKIERHIKNMKSRSYIMNLKKYPEMQQRLLNRFVQ